MKNFFLAATIAISALTAQAQEPVNPPKNKQQKVDPAVRAQKQTERMAAKLNFTEDQKAKITAINLDKNKQVKAVNEQYKDNKEMLDKERKRINKERAAEIKKHLTAEQLQKWEELKKERKAQKDAKKKNENTDGEILEILNN
ncbi:MAG: hypothetical protein J0L87_04585 [Bacteroidetes bacterium]|nr:hypothetical protein [Bacteroidota bacterium]